MINGDAFDQELLGKIKKEHISPKPKWQFRLKNYLLLAGGIICIFIGGLAVSIIIYFLRYNDWDVFNEAEYSYIKIILLSLPYYWFLFLVLFFAITYFDFKNTKNGYKYPLYIIFLSNIVLSLILGGIFYKTGVSQAMDDVLGEKIPLYPQMINSQVKIWSSPENGRISGVIVDVKGNKFEVIDLKQKKWMVNSDQVGTTSIDKKIKLGEPVRIIGEKTEESIFKAKKILPPPLPGRGFFKQHKNKNFPPRPPLPQLEKDKKGQKFPEFFNFEEKK